MIHQETFTARWHDTDALRRVRPGAMLAMMQETSNLQFLRAGRSLEQIRDEQGVGFVLGRIAVDLLRPVSAYEQLLVETFTCPGHALTFPRGFRVFCGEECVARCHSTWALMRVADRTLVRTEAFPLCFGDEPLQDTAMPLRFAIPRGAELQTVGERRIVYTDLDYNLHMNNTKYPDMVCDFLPDPLAVRVTGISLAYYREAAFGDTVTVSRAQSEDGTFYFRTEKDGNTCLEAMVRTESA